MDSKELTETLTTLFSELVHGAPDKEAYMLNRGDAGLLKSIEDLTAEAASTPSGTGSTDAAHLAHVRYGLSLMNRWSAGENPFADADWTQSWKKSKVTEPEWAELKKGLKEEAQRWLQALGEPRELSRLELNGVVGSIAHLAYHVGAIRQMQPKLRGPDANDF